MDMQFYKNKKVLVTGHTGFKGAWMCELLLQAGAEVTGYALTPPTIPSLFQLLSLEKHIHSVIGDIRNLVQLEAVFKESAPEIVIHMAAQPLVRESYQNPAHTYDVNVMGTVNILECVRKSNTVQSFVNVTTDKVYKNREWEWGYRENEELNGYDPYSNSKSCSELVTGSYRNSFFEESDIAISTVRAGNVIGGGDFAKDRIIPDCVKAALKQETIYIRNPYAVRPFQHVLEPIAAYLLIAMKQYEAKSFAGCYNVGPDEADCLATEKLADLFCDTWNDITGDNLIWVNQWEDGPHEAKYLKLDCSKIKRIFQWNPVWNIEQAVQKVVEWSVAYQQKNDIRAEVQKQIKDYLTCE